MSKRNTDSPIKLFIEELEPRQMLSGTGFETSAFEYRPSDDPSVGAVVTAFIDNDFQDPSNTYDILTGWKAAVDELASVGIAEVTFAVFRNVSSGNLSGGPTVATVDSAVQYANARNLSVTILPLFEANGWRGEYDPSGGEQTRFRTQYTQFIDDLAGIEGIDRFNIGSELNQMVENASNASFFSSLISTVENRFQQIGNTSGRIGYAANFDAYQNPEHVALLTQPGIDFMGVSAYRSLISASNAALVSGTGDVSQAALTEMINNWNIELDALEAFGLENNLPLVIQEFGAVQQNYASVAPWSTDPGDWVNGSDPDRFAADAKEQGALYESLLRALDGRRDSFESVVAWTWEHQASRGRRTFDQLGETGVFENFAIWPTDEGGGQTLVEFLDTRQDEEPEPTSTLEVLARGATGEETFDVIVDDVVVGTQVNVSTELTSYSFAVDTTVTADRIKVAFTNDLNIPSIGKDRNLFVDKIVIGGEAFESESPLTFVSLVYSEELGITSGYVETELLNIDGHFAYQAGVAEFESGPESSQKDQFGNAVAIDGGFAIVGARLEEDSASDRNSGRAHIYQKLDGQWTFLKSLSAELPHSGDQFGYAVDISGDQAIVGAILADGTSTNQGAVYVFSRNSGGLNNWGLVKEIANPFPIKDDQFGIDVAIEDDRIVVGAWLANDPIRSGTNQGAAFVFEKDLGGADQWGLAKVLQSNDELAASDKLGNSVAIANDVIVVGAESEGPDKRGAVYVYEPGLNNDWTQVAKLENPDPAVGDQFGTNVALSEKFLVVAAPFDDEQGVNSGSVYLYYRGNEGQWVLGQTLTANRNLDFVDGRANDRFGSSIAISGNRLVVGASATNHLLGGSGLVYEYLLDDEGSWEFEKFYRPESVRSGDRFGQSVAIAGGETIMGSPLRNESTFSVDNGGVFFNSQYIAPTSIPPVALAASRSVFLEAKAPAQSEHPVAYITTGAAESVARGFIHSSEGGGEPRLIAHNLNLEDSEYSDGPALIELRFSEE